MIDMANLDPTKMSKADLMKSMAKENKDITDNIKHYLSKADKFAVRMSAAVERSGVFKSKALKGTND